MLTICILLSFTLCMSMPAPIINVYDVTRYGTITDERTDIAPAFTLAWKEACAMPTGINKVVIPKGRYTLGMIELTGPCKADMSLEIQGTLMAPTDLGGDRWISFKIVDRFRIYGHGTLDGQGSLAWKLNDCAHNPNCGPFPITMRLNSINNSVIQGVTSINSKNFHFNLLNCHNFVFNRVTVYAPESSLNTDGIHVGESSFVKIMNTNIATGDDCISIGPGTHDLNITGVKCRQGHGISVGSLGRYENENPVSGVYVSKCKISNTDQAIRIKTWPDRQPNVAHNLHYEDIDMDNVSIPILINQMYCPSSKCDHKPPSKVKIKHVYFKNIRGTSSSPIGIKLKCSSGLPCEDIEFMDIDLNYNLNQSPSKIEYTNVVPRFVPNPNPNPNPTFSPPKLPIRMLMFQG